MKCELLLEEEEKKEKIEGEKLPPLNLEEIPMLSPPILRKPTRNVTLNELINALNKAFQFKERKESKKLRIRRAAETLIEEGEDIEEKISEIFKQIMRHGVMIRFSDLVPTWKRKEIVETFIPLLHLSQRGKVNCEQKEMFKEIFINLSGSNA